MTHTESPPTDWITAEPGMELLAVQQQWQSVPVDWQGFQDTPESGYAAFQGAVFIVDRDGAQLCEASWEEGSDDAADVTLTRLGLHRLGDWTPDLYGRRTTRVALAPVFDPVRATIPRPPSARRAAWW